MLELEGKNGKAVVYTDNVEEQAVGQIIHMLNSDISKGATMCIMPDVHYGKGSTIGTTIKLPEDFEEWKVSPNVVGIDLGCGILMYKLSDEYIDYEELDKVINKKVPSGFHVHQTEQNKAFTDKTIDNLSFNLTRNVDRVHQSLGTLGGGNHFIELGKDEEGSYWLSVHSGSRNLGVQVATHHQDIAIQEMERGYIDVDEVINKLKAENRHQEIEGVLAGIKENHKKLSHKEKELAYLQGDLLKDYLNDIELAQQYAIKSRETMLDIIVNELGLTVVDQFDSIHNFIEHDNFREGIVRKGATSARKGERMVIPLNMRDGSIIATGKGNKDWNWSAPHGAGRLMSRRQAKENIELAHFKDQMQGVYSSSVNAQTLDESPDAYKSAQEIKQHIVPTAEINHIIKPVYNYKA